MFHVNLKLKRLHSGLTQKQVADCLNISAQSVSKWEKGEALPSIEFLPKLAECLNCEIGDFFLKTEEAPIDLDGLEEYFRMYEATVCDEKNAIDNFIKYVMAHRVTCDNVRKIFTQLKEYKLVNERNIQGIFACDEGKLDAIIKHLIKCEMIEWIDAANAYFVIKDVVDGYLMLQKAYLRIGEIQLEKEKEQEQQIQS